MNKPKTYHSKGDEALRILKGEQSIIIVPIEPQPDTVIDGVPLLTTGKDSIAPAAVGMEPIKSPLGQPGDIIHVKEKWCELYDYEDHDELPGCPREEWSMGYGYEGDTWIIKPFSRGWKSPITMPLEAVRCKPVIKKVEVKQLRDVKHEDVKFDYDPFKDIDDYVWVYTTNNQ